MDHFSTFFVVQNFSLSESDRKILLSLAPDNSCSLLLTVAITSSSISCHLIPPAKLKKLGTCIYGVSTSSYFVFLCYVWAEFTVITKSSFVDSLIYV